MKGPLLVNQDYSPDNYNVKIGDRVKVKAINIEDSLFKVEAFWVNINRIHVFISKNNEENNKFTKYFGKVDNNLILDTGYQFGDDIDFMGVNIFDIER